MLLNPSHLETLKKEGVVKIPFLSASELDETAKLYDELHSGGEPPTMYNGIHMTIWHSDLHYKLQVNSRLKEILKTANERTFHNYRSILEQFIVKRNSPETTFPVHQDWSIVDEFKFSSFNLWIPLQDVDEKNGAMWIVKGSHRIDRKIRGAGYLFPDYRPVMETLKSKMTSFPMKAGEALLFYHRTIHGSPYNSSDSERVVVQSSIVPKNAPLQIYFQPNAEAKLELHQPSDDFSLYYGRLREDSELRPPTNNPKETLPKITVSKVTVAELSKSLDN